METETIARMAARAWGIYSQGKDCMGHPYLKGLSPCEHLKVVEKGGEDILMIPLLDSFLDFSDLLFINETGEKRLLGGRPINDIGEGSFFFIGALSIPKLYVGVELSDMLSLSQVTGQPSFVTFTLGNLPAVVDTILSEGWFKPHQLVLASIEEDFDAVRSISKEYGLPCLLHETNIKEAANG